MNALKKLVEVFTYFDWYLWVLAASTMAIILAMLWRWIKFRRQQEVARGQYNPAVAALIARVQRGEVSGPDEFTHAQSNPQRQAQRPVGPGSTHEENGYTIFEVFVILLAVVLLVLQVVIGFVVYDIAGYWNMIQVQVAVIAFYVTVIYGWWSCSKNDFLWMQVPIDQIVILTRGERNPVKYIGLRRRIRWINIHWKGWGVEKQRFPILHKRYVQGQEDPKLWIEADKTPQMTDHLNRVITHWVKVTVIFRGVQPMRLLFKYSGRFLTEEDVYKAVYILNGGMYEFANGSIESEVRAFFKDMDAVDFRGTDYSAGAGSISETKLLPLVQPSVRESSGIQIDSIDLVTYAPGDDKEDELQRSEREAEIRSRAAKVLAEGETASWDKTLESTRRHFPDASPDVALQESARVAVAREYSDPNSNVIATNSGGQGSGTGIVIDPASRKGGGRNKRRR